jgi:hypothetical protein
VRKFNIAVELGGLIPDGVPLTADALPSLAAAVKELAEQAHAQWISYAMGAPLPNGLIIQNRTGEYARSILLHQTGPFSAEVSSSLPYAQSIEEGMPKRDLKDMLNFSNKVRVSKKGKRYLIIPFRWNTPNSVLGRAMPQPVYNWWRRAGRDRSHITSEFERIVGHGPEGLNAHRFDIKTRQLMTTPGRTYSWGSRLGRGDLDAMGITGKRASQMVGMVAFRNPTATKGGRGGKYLSFRAMVEGSPGWQSPAQPGKWPARTAAGLLLPVAEDTFRRAVQEDVGRLLGNA